ncbi:AraC family transcriptional regulator [Ammonicoccus fulvus]|uniref:AraC family transcriptional regulator n=1 Tax=Ammonicoccus fulvus TaxID=3138240 RepID=A0ABZ3FQ66_9ACTN
MTSVGLRTRDVDVARDEIARLFCPHQLRPAGKGLDVRMKAHTLGKVDLVGLDYGHTVRITPGELGTFYLAQLPLHGSARIRFGRDTVTSTSGVAAVLSPDDPVDMIWAEGTPQLLCRIDRSALDEEFRLLTGEEPNTPVRFRPVMSVGDRGGRTWMTQLRRSWQLSTKQPSDGAPDGVGDLLTSLLLLQPHNHSALLLRAANDVGITRRAMHWMENRVAEPVSIPEVAAGVGVGVRALQRAFRNELDTTPLAWLKRRRLEIARERLRSARPGSATVTSVAAGVGLSHLGRFALEYHALFGENPSDTLAAQAIVVGS